MSQCAAATSPLGSACATEASTANTQRDLESSSCSTGCQSTIDRIYEECAGTTGQDQTQEWSTEVAGLLEAEARSWGCDPKVSAASASAPLPLGALLVVVAMH
eukprot:SAG11_NODE_916_length_6555_cov_5.026332_6_plen_103_part_00